MKLFALAASHRKESVNRKLLRLAARIAEANGASVETAEYGALDMPTFDNETYRDQKRPEAAVRFVEHLRASEGILLASPEYNWSFPGSLKNMIDWASVASPNPFAARTALLLSASPSLRGGTQGLIHLRVPLESLGVFVYPRMFALARAEEALDGDGALRDLKLATELQMLVAKFVKSTAALTHKTASQA